MKFKSVWRRSPWQQLSYVMEFKLRELTFNKMHNKFLAPILLLLIVALWLSTGCKHTFNYRENKKNSQNVIISSELTTIRCRTKLALFGFQCATRSQGKFVSSQISIFDTDFSSISIVITCTYCYVSYWLVILLLTLALLQHDVSSSMHVVCLVFIRPTGKHPVIWVISRI